MLSAQITTLGQSFWLHSANTLWHENLRKSHYANLLYCLGLKVDYFAVFTVLVVSCPDPTLAVRIQAAYDNCPGYAVHVLTAGTSSHALLTDRSSMELLLKLAANHYSRHTVQPQSFGN